MDIAELVTAAEAAVESVETPLRTVLDEHFPQLKALAAKVMNDPLIQAAVQVAEDVALPPAAKPVIADFLVKLAASYRQPAAAEPAPEPQAA